MLNALTKFATSFNQVIEGTNRDLSTRELYVWTYPPMRA
jgi:hypothetical protein